MLPLSAIHATSAILIGAGRAPVILKERFAHIAELDRNLESLRHKLSETDYWRLRVLIHSHDTFKGKAQPNAPITASNSHASLARAFLADFCADDDMLAIVQFHDEPYALWRQVASKGKFNQQRLTALLAGIRDWNLFLAFNIIDGCTEEKGREPLRWFFEHVAGKVRFYSGRHILARYKANICNRIGGPCRPLIIVGAN